MSYVNYILVYNSSHTVLVSCIYTCNIPSYQVLKTWGTTNQCSAIALKYSQFESSLPVAVLATVDSLTIAVSGIPPLMLMHTVINPADSSTVMAVSKNMMLATEYK